MWHVNYATEYIKIKRKIQVKGAPSLGYQHDNSRNERSRVGSMYDVYILIRRT